MIENGTKRTWKNVINEKAVQAANFVWSTYLLIMLDTLLLRPSLHFTQLHSASLHLSTFHFLSFKLHPTTLHYPLIWFNPISISYRSIHLTSLHFTSPHITTLHFTSHHYTSLHCTFRGFSPRFCSFNFTAFIIALLTLFLKILGLQGKVPNVLVPVFSGPIYKGILPAIRFLFPVPNFPNMINPAQIVRPSQPVAYGFPSPLCNVQLNDIHKEYADTITQFDSISLLRQCWYPTHISVIRSECPRVKPCHIPWKSHSH